MKHAESKIEYAFVKHDVTRDGQILFSRGEKISARSVRDCYQRYGLKIEVECSCGAPIQTRSYIKKSPRKSVYFCLKPGNDHTTDQCGYIKSQMLSANEQSKQTASHKAPTYFKFLPDKKEEPNALQHEHTFLNESDNDSENKDWTSNNLTYNIRSICQYYLQIISYTENRLERRKDILDSCELTTPHHLSITYNRLFKPIDSIKQFHMGSHAIFFGRVEKVIHCSDGAIIVFQQKKNTKTPAIVLLRNHQLGQFKRWHRLYQTLKGGKFNHLCHVFVYGALEQSFDTTFIDVNQHGCIAFMQHPIEKNHEFWHESSNHSIDAYIGRCFRNQFTLYSKSATGYIDPVIQTKIDAPLTHQKADNHMLRDDSNENTIDQIHYFTLPQTLRKRPIDDNNERAQSSSSRPLHEHLGYNLDDKDNVKACHNSSLGGLDVNYTSMKLPIKSDEVSFPMLNPHQSGVLKYVKKFFNKLF